jgi:hypothetical protein
MILKRKRIKLGKQIRKLTGIKLNEAIFLAKRILKGECLYSIACLYDNTHIDSNVFCECCGPEGHNILGPKGSLIQSDVDKLVNELG